MKNEKFLNGNGVAAYLEILIQMANMIIRKLNDELAARGYMAVAGRISKAFFKNRRSAILGLREVA